MREFALKSLRKSCSLDPLPALVIKECFDMLIPVITQIVNLSLTLGTMPESLKLAELLPSLKKHDADHEIFQNFRPISNLPMVSKVVEKAVADQFTRHILTNHLDKPFQSAYKAFHSTETALVKVQNDILQAIDQRQSVILLLLDLSAAFDTVDHSTLLSRLSTSFGIKGTVLAWFQSYLTSRQQYVRVAECKSSLRSLTRGELQVFTSKFRANPELDSVVVIDESITPEPHARNLGIIPDTYLTFNNHIAKVCKVSHFHLRNISKIRKFLSKESTEILIHAFVSSKLDHCNSLLYGLPAYQLAKLQVLQNTAARVVSLTKKYDHITPVLESLHWLPVKFRIVFKVLLLVYKALNGMAPPYLSDMLCYRSYSRSLRSASQKLLVVHRTNMKTYGDRAFSIAGPKLWNQLPLSIRELSSIDSFKKSLKTYLFRLAYS